MSEQRPFVAVANSAGYMADNLSHLYAWLQSDAVRDFRARPTKVALGAAVDDLLGNPATLRVDADDADPERYPTGERESPRDDITFPVDRFIAVEPPDAVLLLQQVPPAPHVEEGTNERTG